MNKVIQNKKYTRKNENNLKTYGYMSNDSLQNLLISIEKYKFMIFKSNINSMLLNSSNATVINCINHVISEFGEESLKRYSNKNIVKETGDNQKEDYHNNLWTEIVKHLQEIITSNKDIDNELYGLILTMISQVHERQSLKVFNPQILQDICGKLVGHLDFVDIKIRARYLRCLASFILGNLNNIQKELFTVLSSAFFHDSEHYLAAKDLNFDSLESLKYCISGLTNLCYISSSTASSASANSQQQQSQQQQQSTEDFLSKRFQICGKFLQIFIGCLEKSPDLLELSPISRFRMQHQCLHGLNYVSQRPHGLSVDNIERFLEVLRLYCGFGLFKAVKLGDGVTFTALTTCGSVTTENEEMLATTTTTTTGAISTEELELSDAAHFGGASYHSRPMRKWEMKTRRLALELLLKVLDKSWKKVGTSIWVHFMPLGTFPCRSRFHLVNMLERERDTFLRSLVLQAVERCVASCRDFLVTAQHQPTSATFVSRSHSLACALVELHSRLLQLLFIDRSAHIRLGVLSCLAVLLRTAPYHRLRQGLISSVVASLRQLYFESERDQTVLRCAILDCFTALVGLESVSREMRQLLLEPPRIVDNGGDVIGATTAISVTSSASSALFGAPSQPPPSWLVQLCVRLAHPVLVDRLWTGALSPEAWGAHMDPLVAKAVAEGSQQPDGVTRCQALVTVGAMLAQHGQLVRPSLDTLKRTLLACLDESLKDAPNGGSGGTEGGYQLRSHVLRVFSGFLGTLAENKRVKRYLGIMQDCCQDDNNHMEPFQSSFFTTTSDELVCDWWSAFLQPIIQCLQDDSDAVRRSAAQCLCFMCEPVLRFMIDPDEMRHYWGLLLQMFHDSCTAVSCQAIWSLGYWVAMRPLNTDAEFIRALIDACMALCEAALVDCSLYLVCANAAWTLSNAVEVLVAHREALLPCCHGGASAGDSHQCADLVEQYLTDFQCIGVLMRLFCNLCSLKKAGQVAASARIHENAIRGLGYLCRFINADVIVHLRNQDLLSLASETFCKAVQLPDKAGRVKVKWNACLSASHVYHNGALIATDDVFNLHQLTSALVTSVANDRYFKVRNNSLVSIITLIDAGGRPSFGEHLFDTVIIPLAEACLSVNQKSTIPFSEVHRHCLCLYLLHFTILKLLNLLTLFDLEQLTTKTSFISLLSTVFSEQLPLIWTHLRNLNRSFNKQALLTHTLMLKPSVSATYEEVDLLLSHLHANLAIRWIATNSNRLAVDLLGQLYRLMREARIVEEEIKAGGDEAQYICDPGSDDDGLLTKRSGTSLIFSQIYD